MGTERLNDLITARDDELLEAILLLLLGISTELELDELEDGHTEAIESEIEKLETAAEELENGSDELETRADELETNAKELENSRDETDKLDTGNPVDDGTEIWDDDAGAGVSPEGTGTEETAAEDTITRLLTAAELATADDLDLTAASLAMEAATLDLLDELERALDEALTSMPSVPPAPPQALKANARLKASKMRTIE